MGTSQTITATFSEPMNSASIVASGTFTVNAPGPTPVAGTVTYDATNNTAIFTPTGTFASQHRIYRHYHNCGTERGPSAAGE